MRRTIYKFHKWLGLAFGLLLMAQAGSGVLLSFRPQIQSLELAHHAGGDAKIGVNEAVTAVLGAYPQVWPERAYVAPQGDAVVVRLAENHNRRFVVVSRKHDGVVLAGLPLHGTFQWLFEWHEGLWWGGAGRWVLVFQALLLVGFVGSGLYFWWPLRRKQGLKIKWQAPPVRLWYDLHRVIGVFAAPFLVVLVLTGSVMVVRALASGGDLKPPVKQAQVARVDEALNCQACGRLKEFRFSPDGGYHLIYASKSAPWPLAADSIAISPEGRPSPRLAQDAASAQKVLGWMYPLHTGKALGWFGQMFVLVAGLALFGLPVFGGLLWLRRRPKKKAVAHGA
ncbi:PepSY-associated TM helix domain-containing protein [Kordiimonas lacus]|nr:PepSY-associated TM helix domain-containing protein [Kordiimonas lacus]